MDSFVNMAITRKEDLIPSVTLSISALFGSLLSAMTIGSKRGWLQRNFVTNLTFVIFFVE